MIPATTAQRRFEFTKLAVAQNGSVHHRQFGEILDYLHPGDLLVVNRSGTLPSSFRGVILRSSAFVEIRLAAFAGHDSADFSRWQAIAFGSGDWRMPTENRGPAPHLQIGDLIKFKNQLVAKVLDVHPDFNRLIRIEFLGEDVISKLLKTGSPIQYSYLKNDLEIWDQQTIFAGLPISVEPPSAGFPFTWKIFDSLRAHRVDVATILHGAGISSSGDPQLDHLLPLDEYFEVPNQTVQKIIDAKNSGKNIISLGTTVVRALESDGVGGYTSLKIDAKTKLRVVDSIITGMHKAGTSHLKLLEAFQTPKQIQTLVDETSAKKYLSHEFGDAALIFKSDGS